MDSSQLILSQTLGDINGLSEELQNLIAAGEVDMEILGKAVLMQKILGASGLSPEDLGKAILLQQGMLEAGATPEGIAACLQKALNVSKVLIFWEGHKIGRNIPLSFDVTT